MAVKDVPLTLKCEGLKGRPGFEGRMFAREADEGFAIERGDYLNTESNHDLWKVTVHDGLATVSGEYREGAGGIKGVKVEGTWGREGIALQGWRGPGSCQVDGHSTVD